MTITNLTSFPFKSEAMLKKLIILAGIIVVVIIGVVIYAASNANSLIAQYKPELEKAASQAVGSPVTLGQLSVSIFPTTKVEVAELQVGSKEKLSLKNFYLALGLMDLLRGQLTIKKIGVSNPEIVIRKVGDQLFIPGVPTAKENTQEANAAAPAAKQSAGGASAGSPLKVAVQGLEVSNASITIDDRDAGKIKLARDFDLATRIELEGKTISLPSLEIDGKVLESTLSVKGSSSFGENGSKNTLSGSLRSLTAAELTRILNAFKVALPVKIDGSLGSEFGIRGTGSAPELTAKTDLSAFGLVGSGYSKSIGKKLIAAVDAKVSQLSPLVVNSSTKLDIEELNVGPTYLANLTGSLKANMSGTSLTASSDDLALNLGKEPVKITLAAETSPGDVELKQLKIAGFGGDTTLAASIFGNDLKSVLKIANVQINQLINAVLPALPLPVKGTVNSVGATVSGRMGDQLMNSLTGPLTAELGAFTIEGFNLLGKVLSELKKAPMLSSAEVGAEHKADVESKDTKFTGATLDAFLSNGELQIRSARAESTLFNAGFNGVVGLNGAINLKGLFILERPITMALTASAKDTAKFANENGQLEIPVIIKGQGSDISVLPDIEALMKSAAGKALQQQAGKALNRLLGGKSKGGSLFGF